jgi:hypothetical protein
LEALKRFELDLVIGNLDAKTPWKKEIAFTRPYFTERVAGGSEREHVMAAPPGENAWLKRVGDFLQSHRSSVPALLQASSQPPGNALRDGLGVSKELLSCGDQASLGCRASEDVR